MIKKISYPWHVLFPLPEETEIDLFVYGALLDEEKWNKYNIGSVWKTKKEAFLYGWRRVCDFPFDNSLVQKEGAFNIRKTGNSKDVVNGLFLRLNLNELWAIGNEEMNYDLVLLPITIIPSCSRNGLKNCNKCCVRFSKFQAWTFCCMNKSLIDQSLDPRSEYLERCLNAASSLGNEFKSKFIESSFCADGLTSAYRNTNLVRA